MPTGCGARFFAPAPAGTLPLRIVIKVQGANQILNILLFLPLVFAAEKASLEPQREKTAAKTDFLRSAVATPPPLGRATSARAVERAAVNVAGGRLLTKARRGRGAAALCSARFCAALAAALWERVAAEGGSQGSK